MLPLCSAPLIALLVAGEDWRPFLVGTLFTCWDIIILSCYLNASIYLVKGGRLGLLPRQEYPTLLVPICLSQGFYSCTNIMTKKQVGEERVYSAYTSILLFITKEVRTGTQAGQEAGADAEAMEGCSLLACFPWLAQPALL